MEGGKGKGEMINYNIKHYLKAVFFKGAERDKCPMYFLFSVQFRTLAHGTVSPIFSKEEDVIKLQSKLSGKALMDTPEACLLGGSKPYQVGSKISHHSCQTHKTIFH